MSGRSRALRLGVAGGGTGSMIGPMHRRAALLDGRFEIVAGVLSSDPARSRAGGAAIGLAAERCYGSAEEMLDQEERRPDGIEALAVMTPNDGHHSWVSAALRRGLDVICDKPLAISGAEAVELLQLARQSGAVVCVTHPYSGYPMIRQARALVASGAIGAVRAVQVDYLGSGLARAVENTPEGARRWRLDPARAGPSLVLSDLGTHAHHLAVYVTGEPVAAIRAELGSLTPDRRFHDYAELGLRLVGGARGRISLCQAAAGQDNHIALRVIGETASLDWQHGSHEKLLFSPLDGPRQVFVKGAAWLAPEARHAARMERAGHPEGMLEAFANLYGAFADAVLARSRGVSHADVAEFPGALDGARGVWLIEAALRSEATGHGWVRCRLDADGNRFHDR